jgi:hypothetical protein
MEKNAACEIQGSQRPSLALLRLRPLYEFVELAPGPLGRRLDVDGLAGVNRAERACFDLACALRPLGRDLAELGHVQDLQGAASM